MTTDGALKNKIPARNIGFAARLVGHWSNEYFIVSS
jgi:hypothetical protein